ncbi:MAG: VacJ family lipoprotein [Burkholderiales bacterium]|nr:VacJ family lipoprotein [Burkholderiales bacterium]
MSRDTLGAGWGAKLRRAAAALLVALSAGCATPNGDPRDPIEGFNRAMFSFNEAFDQAIGKPVATAYREVIPGPVRTWVRNFFSNIADLFIGVNNLLQGKPADALSDWARFAFNTTIGLFGINDVASDMGFEKHDEDFGQTFGRWGVPDGAYIVWPFLGSSTVRDTVGLVFDIGLDPVWRHEPRDPRRFMLVLRAVGRRADLLDASRILEEAALDKYVFQRDAYLQRRRSLIHDGNPPRAERPEAPRAERADLPHAGAALEERPGAEEARRDLSRAGALLEEPAAAPQSHAEPFVGSAPAGAPRGG